MAHRVHRTIGPRRAAGAVSDRPAERGDKERHGRGAARATALPTRKPATNIGGHAMYIGGGLLVLILIIPLLVQLV